MRKEDFAILHETQTTQLLVTKDYNHIADEHILNVRLWSFKANSLVRLTPIMKGNQKVEFQQMFDNMRNIDIAIQFTNSLLVKCGLNPELKKIN